MPKLRSTARSNRLGRRPCSRLRQRGVTLIEALCTCAVTLAAIGASAGNLSDFLLGQRLKAAAAELEAEVNLARSIAMVRAQTVRLAIQPLAQGSCTVIHTGPEGACSCGESGPALCTGDDVALHLNRHDGGTGVRHLSTGTSVAFSAMRGTVTPTATIRLADAKGRALHQIVNVMGRTRTCSPLGAVSGYPVC